MARGDLVVVGSSAEGVGALSTLVGTLSKDFPPPIVLAQHLDPQRPSNLDTILERRSSLPIVVVSEDPPTLLESGKIYVVPANRHEKISDGHVHLMDHDNRPRPSVDMLLSSAAKAYGERLIAVILTGSGSDGAVGAVDMKNAGGAVMRDLLGYIGSQTNIDFRNYRSSTIMRRVARWMAVTRKEGIRDYTEYVRTHNEEAQQSKLSAVLERFPYYVMVLNADDLTIQAINPGYASLLGKRDVIGLPMSEVFTGRDLDKLLKLLKRTGREGQPLTTEPMSVHVAEREGIGEPQFIHTVVPIRGTSGKQVARLFIYSEKVP